MNIFQLQFLEKFLVSFTSYTKKHRCTFTGRYTGGMQKGYESSCLLECDALLLGDQFLVFQKITVPL